MELLYIGATLNYKYIKLYVASMICWRARQRMSENQQQLPSSGKSNSDRSTSFGAKVQEMMRSI